MTSTLTYENLALEWNPRGKKDGLFIAILLSSLIAVMTLGYFLSSIKLPAEDRKARTVVPERIAQMVLEQEKKKPKPDVPPPVKPKPKPKPIEKKPEQIKKERDIKDKPLTKSEKDAKEKAKGLGIMAIANELVDLIDTSSIDDMVSGNISKSDGSANTASTLDKSILTENSGKGSGGISSDRYASIGVGSTQLSDRERSLVRQSLLSKEVEDKISGSAKPDGSNGVNGNRRAEEEVTLVFDQNKGRLYSIYNKERRRNPGLKGKIVLEITIAPNGKVVSVTIISSELNNPKLENSLVSRIKLFKFSSGKTAPLTVSYPIEFLPS